jgi:hypothetical protein
MRLLPALLLLAACITEPPPPSSPLFWFSGPRVPNEPRVGTVDRERVVEAYYGSEQFAAYTAALTRERERAEAAGAAREAAALRHQERNLDLVRTRQLEGGGGVANIIIALENILPEIAATRGLDMIVEEGTWMGPARTVVDVTDDVVDRLPPAED